MLRVAVYSLAACAVLLSCAGSSGSGGARAPVVTVGGGAIPTISWMPDGAQVVRVYRGLRPAAGYSADLMWSLAAQRPNSILSPVTYGMTPPGASVDATASPLQPGQLYTIVVARIDTVAADSGRAEQILLEGSTTFTP